MRSLRLVSPGDDGGPADGDPPAVGAVGGDSADGPTGSGPAPVTVAAADGERFELVVDDALREALLARRSVTDGSEAPTPVPDPPVTGASEAVDPLPEPRPQIALSPRDIQTRVRAGESPQELATATGNPLDRIMRFAGAVQEERSRVGGEARRARARRDGDGTLVPFGETVDGRFSAHGIDPATVTWDAFRRPDGAWIVTAGWTAGSSERRAHWTFSLATRTVLPIDDTASDLLSDRALRPIVRAVPDGDSAGRDRAGPNGEPAGRDGQPGDAVYDQETSSYTRPRSERRSGRQTAGAEREHPDPAPETSAQPLRLADPLPIDDDAPDLMTGDLDDQLATDAAQADVARTRARPSDEQPRGRDGDVGLAGLFGPHGDDEEASAAGEASSAAPGRAPARTRGTGRSKAAREQTRIPSWDDILLGVRRRQD